MTTIKHNEEFIVRSYEIDQAGRATLPVIANYFQEAAGKNAKDLDFDIEDLHKKGVTWVLYRMHIKMESFPVRWQRVTVNTWPSSGDGVRAFRDYQLAGENGEILGKAVSQWMVLNIKNRRPTRIPEEILKMGLSVAKHQLPVDKSSFPKMRTPDSVTRLSVGHHHLDMNRHVNNVVYIEWMTGFIQDLMEPSAVCTEMKIQYHRECGYGQAVLIKTSSLSDSNLLHVVCDEESGTILAEGISGWRNY